MSFKFDDQIYQICAIGSVAQNNLAQLGHISIIFDGSNTASLPGSIHLANKSFPDISIDTIISITK